MTRRQKAAAGLGSVAVVGLVFVLQWSLAGGLAFWLLGLLGAVGVLRLTHPSGRARPTLADLGVTGAQSSGRSLTPEAILAAQAEVERGRAQAVLRERERAELLPEPPPAPAPAAEPARSAEEAILIAGERAALDETGDGAPDLDEAQRQRVYLLNKVRLKLSDYE